MKTNGDGSIEYAANFLYPADSGSIEEAGYEFANGHTEEYRKLWWDILIERVGESVGLKKRVYRRRPPTRRHCYLQASWGLRTVCRGEYSALIPVG